MRQRLVNLVAAIPILPKAAANRYFLHNRFIMWHLYRFTPFWRDFDGHNILAIRELHRTLAHGPCMVFLWWSYAVLGIGRGDAGAGGCLQACIGEWLWHYRREGAAGCELPGQIVGRRRLDTVSTPNICIV